MSKPFRHTTTYYRRLRKEKERSHGDATNANSMPSTSGSAGTTSATSNVHVQSDCDTSQSQNTASQITNEQQSITVSEMDDDVSLREFSSDEKLSNNPSTSESDVQDDSDEDKEDKIILGLRLREDLRQWALEDNIKHSAINNLLKVLKKNNITYNLPEDARALLQTPRSTHLITMGNGLYWYHGIRNCLSNSNYIFEDIHSPLYITINIDGIPVAKSAKKEFWPILIKLDGFNILPMVVAIYYGCTKPPVNDFLRPFVDEMLLLLNNGVEIDGKTFNILIKCFVCDTPARCFIKGTIGFNGYNSCMKCTIVGEYDRRGRHMTFPRVDMPLRTNHSFRNRLDPDHHKETTCIEELPIDLIEDFVVADSLHLLHLGIMKRCLLGWINGTFNYRSKWSARDIQEITCNIIDIKSTTPYEVHEGRMRGLDTIHFWKGAEFRNFLMYFGPVLLKNHLTSDVYNHFLLLFCATVICSSEIYKPYLHLALTLYETYIEQYIHIYGHDSISSNVHNLCHIVQDVIKFGPLPKISTYPFESMLNTIKNLIRKGETPLQQVANRILELSHTKTEKMAQEFPTFKHLKILNEKQVYTMICLKKNFSLRCTVKDKWFLSTNNCVVEMQYAEIIEERLMIAGKKIKKTFDFFELPIKSRYLNIHAILQNYEQEDLQLYELNQILCKLISIRDNSIIVFLPILSTIQIF